jgi:hypothetical protein
MQALSDVFRNRIISSGIWPARSPELHPCDFYFWGYLKGRVYHNNPRREEGQKENIRRGIANISPEHIERVNQNPFR